MKAGDGYTCSKPQPMVSIPLRKALRRRPVAELTAARRKGMGLGGLTNLGGLENQQQAT